MKNSWNICMLGCGRMECCLCKNDELILFSILIIVVVDYMVRMKVGWFWSEFGIIGELLKKLVWLWGGFS